MLSSCLILQMLCDDPLQRFEFCEISEDNIVTIANKIQCTTHSIFMCVAMLKTSWPHSAFTQTHMRAVERCQLSVKKIQQCRVLFQVVFLFVLFFHIELGTKVPTLLTLNHNGLFITFFHFGFNSRSL